MNRRVTGRHALPPGGLLKQDYRFAERVDGENRLVRFSELFDPGKSTLFLHSFMYSLQMQNAGPICSALLDGLRGQVEHLVQRINLAIVAKHSFDRIRSRAAIRATSTRHGRCGMCWTCRPMVAASSFTRRVPARRISIGIDDRNATQERTQWDGSMARWR